MNRRRAALVLTGIFLLAVLYGVLYVRNWMRIRRESPPLMNPDNLPEDLPAAEGGFPDAGELQSFYFVADGIVLYPDMDVTVLPEGLTEPDSVFESESCAAQGIAKLYAWQDFEILTWPDKQSHPDPQADRIQYIYLKTDNVQTAEGADLSTPRERIEALYGAGGEGTTENMLVYPCGTMRLVFVFGDDGYPVSIEYRSGIMQ